MFGQLLNELDRPYRSGRLSATDPFNMLVEMAETRSSRRQGLLQLQQSLMIIDKANLLKTNRHLFGDTPELDDLVDDDSDRFLRLADRWYCAEEDQIDDSLLGKLKDIVTGVINDFRRVSSFIPNQEGAVARKFT
jgi:hypothetical protein